MTVVGNSQGGAIAIATALRYPALVEKLVLMAPGGLETRETYMAMEGIKAMIRVLYKEGISKEEIDLYEINEAFSGSTVAVMRQLDLDPSIVNVNGGSVALGHPIGASGCRVLVTLLHEMIKQDKEIGLASLCLGGGEAVAMIVKR